MIYSKRVQIHTLYWSHQLILLAYWFTINIGLNRSNVTIFYVHWNTFLVCMPTKKRKNWVWTVLSFCWETRKILAFSSFEGRRIDGEGPDQRQTGRQKTLLSVIKDRCPQSLNNVPLCFTTVWHRQTILQLFFFSKSTYSQVLNYSSFVVFEKLMARGLVCILEKHRSNFGDCYLGIY